MRFFGCSKPWRFYMIRDRTPQLTGVFCSVGSFASSRSSSKGWQKTMPKTTCCKQLAGVLKRYSTLPETNSSLLKISLPNGKVAFEPLIVRGYDFGAKVGVLCQRCYFTTRISRLWMKRGILSIKSAKPHYWAVPKSLYVGLLCRNTLEVQSTKQRKSSLGWSMEQGFRTTKDVKDWCFWLPQ